MSAAHGHVVVDRSMSSGTATSHAHDTLLPWRTARAAATRTSSVMWFRVPSSSSSPHRPQFDSVLKYPSTSSCVGIGRPAVIAASTPPVTRFEAPQARYPGPRLWHAKARWTGMTLDHDHVRTSAASRPAPAGQRQAKTTSDRRAPLPEDAGELARQMAGERAVQVPGRDAALTRDEFSDCVDATSTALDNLGNAAAQSAQAETWR